MNGNLDHAPRDTRFASVLDPFEGVEVDTCDSQAVVVWDRHDR